MKKIIFLSVIIGFCFSPKAQQCTDSMVRTIKGTWKFDVNKFASNPVAFKTTEAVRNLFYQIDTKPMGYDPRGSSFSSERPVLYFSHSKPFAYRTRYKIYWCSEKTGKIVTDPLYRESNASEVYINTLDNLLEFIDEELYLNKQPVQLFRLAHKKDSLRGMQVYQPFHNKGIASLIFFTHDNKVPYRNVTRGEYALIIKDYWERGMKKTAAIVDERETEILKMIEQTKKEQTGEVRDLILKDLNIALEQFRKEKNNDKIRITTEGSPELAAVQAYLSVASKEDLAKPAIPVSEFSFKGFYDKEQDKSFHIVVKDESYFKKTLNPYAAQFIIVYWDWMEMFSITLDWKKRFETNFDFEKIKAMIDK